MKKNPKIIIHYVYILQYFETMIKFPDNTFLNMKFIFKILNYKLI